MLVLQYLRNLFLSIDFARIRFHPMNDLESGKVRYPVHYFLECTPISYVFSIRKLLGVHSEFRMYSDHRYVLQKDS